MLGSFTISGRCAFHSLEERGVIATNVSTSDLQRQSHKGKLSSNEAFEWLSLHIEHAITHNKTTQTRTFLQALPVPRQM